MGKTSELPEQIRVSLGTAIVLGLLDDKLDAEPTTAYLMTYKTGKCTANCGFCPQARTSKSDTNMLARVTWPTFPIQSVLPGLFNAAEQGKIKRICIQALNYPEVFAHLETIVKEMKSRLEIPISVSCQPQIRVNMERLASAGVDRLGIALDAATEEVFNKVKGSGVGSLYRWGDQFNQLKEALTVFGDGNVSTHVIVGLGETEKEAVEVLQRCVDLGVLPALFAFTPIRGTALEANASPRIESYRRVQIARFLIVSGKERAKDMQFDGKGKILSFGPESDMLGTLIDSGLPFRTSGCPDCNRPFYNEKPSGPMYNYPGKVSKEEIEKIKSQLA